MYILNLFVIVFIFFMAKDCVSLKLLTLERFKDYTFQVSLYDMIEEKEATVLAQTEPIPFVKQDQVCIESPLITTPIVDGIGYLFANEKKEEPFNNVMYTIKVNPEANELSLKRKCEWESGLQIAGGLNQYNGKVYYFSTENHKNDFYQNVYKCKYLNILDPVTCEIEKKKVDVPFIFPWNSCYHHRNECPLVGNTFYMLDSVSYFEDSINRTIYSYNLDSHEQKPVIQFQTDANFTDWIFPTIRFSENHLYSQIRTLGPEKRITTVFDIDLSTLTVEHLTEFEGESQYGYKHLDEIGYYQSEKRIFYLNDGNHPLMSYKMDGTDYIYFGMKSIYYMTVPRAILELYF